MIINQEETLKSAKTNDISKDSEYFGIYRELYLKYFLKLSVAVFGGSKFLDSNYSLNVGFKRLF